MKIVKKGFRKCKNCKEVFEKQKPLQFVCSPKCAIEYSSKKQKEKREKQWKARKKEIKESLLTTKDYYKILQSLINKAVRTIDQNFTCISCGTTKGQMHAGHFHSIGAHPKLRFHLLNNFKQCATCNNHLSGNLLEYRKNLFELFGEAILSDLRNEINKNHTRLPKQPEKLRDLIKTMRNELKTLKPALTNEERMKKRIELNETLNIYKS